MVYVITKISRQDSAKSYIDKEDVYEGYVSYKIDFGKNFKIIHRLNKANKNKTSGLAIESSALEDGLFIVYIDENNEKSEMSFKFGLSDAADKKAEDRVNKVKDNRLNRNRIK